jgi:hypothetical protein
MNRDYKDGKSDSVTFFVGSEVERTPAFGKKTLFVVDVQPVDKIKTYYHAHSCEHIFFGANHSFAPELGSYDSWKQWEDMIYPFLKENYLCTLDIPLSHVEEFNDSGFNEYNTFIPQIRIPMPYLKLWNYNTMVKMDDIGFNKTNPGVWCHSLHDLLDRKTYTDWSQYNLDTIIE